MRRDAIPLEEERLQGIDDIDQYPWFKERHRIFPAAFEERQHRKVLDIAAGVGCAAKRIQDNYPAVVWCNDVSPTCLSLLQRLGLRTVSFDLDDPDLTFPFQDGEFDAVVALVTIEHILSVDHFLSEIRRILCDGGYLYISAPNYAAPDYLLPLMLSGRTFHDPMGQERYEFLAHVRYYTYRTLLEFVRSFGFAPEAVYVPLPGGSSRYRRLYARQKSLALAYRSARWLMFRVLSPSWAPEPIICFQKNSLDGLRPQGWRALRKVVL